jgi:SAM-dependent methyltransferase
MIIYERTFTKGIYGGLYELDWPECDNFLDLGGGSNPFPASTHVLDIADEEYDKQRHGRKIDVGDREFLNGKAEDVLPTFPDKYFDFIYCSHTLEHLNAPFILEELGRVGKAGFIAIPTAEYDVIDTNRSCGHLWFFNMDYANRTLLLRERKGFEFYFDKPTRFLEGILQGHEPGTFFLRAFWEIRFFWKDSIEWRREEDICNNSNFIYQRVFQGKE